MLCNVPPDEFVTSKKMFWGLHPFRKKNARATEATALIAWVDLELIGHLPPVEMKLDLVSRIGFWGYPEVGAIALTGQLRRFDSGRWQVRSARWTRRGESLILQYLDNQIIIR